MKLTKIGAVFGATMVFAAIASPAWADILYLHWTGQVRSVQDNLQLFDMNMVGMAASGYELLDTSRGDYEAFNVGGPLPFGGGYLYPDWLEQRIATGNSGPGPILQAYIAFGDFSFGSWVNLGKVNTEIDTVVGSPFVAPSYTTIYSTNRGESSLFSHSADYLDASYYVDVQPMSGFTLNQNYLGFGSGDRAEFELTGYACNDPSPFSGCAVYTDAIMSFDSFYIADLSLLSVPEPLSIYIFFAGLIGVGFLKSHSRCRQPPQLP